MEDDDLEFSSTKKNRNARTGRRAKTKAEPEPAVDNTPDGEEDTMTMSDNKPNKETRDAPPRPSRRGGWGDEQAKRQKQRRRGGAMEELEDGALNTSDRLRPRTPEDNDSDNDIPVIPDLEETQEEDVTSSMAMAPNVAVNRVATYRELDNDLIRHAAFVTLDNEIDLKILTRGLASDTDVFEDDKPWDWDRLFTEVTSDLHIEESRGDGTTEENGEALGAIP